MLRITIYPSYAHISNNNNNLSSQKKNIIKKNIKI